MNQSDIKWKNEYKNQNFGKGRKSHFWTRTHEHVSGA